MGQPSKSLPPVCSISVAFLLERFALVDSADMLPHCVRCLTVMRLDMAPGPKEIDVFDIRLVWNIILL